MSLGVNVTGSLNIRARIHPHVNPITTVAVQSTFKSFVVVEEEPAGV